MLSRKLFSQGPQSRLAHLDCKKTSFPLEIQCQVSWFWLTRSPFDTSLFCDTLVGQGIRGNQRTHPQIGKQICNLLANPYPIQIGSKSPTSIHRCWIHTFCERWIWIEGNQSVTQLTGSDRLQNPLFIFVNPTGIYHSCPVQYKRSLFVEGLTLLQKSAGYRT